jgi:galactokinase
VLTEAQRVCDFKKVCDQEDLNEDTKIQLLGKLMNDSQESCDQCYDCSSKELNEITKLARDSGALGSRLTGAGWGGCSVSLVKKDILADFITAMYPYFTKDRPEGEKLWVTDDLDRYVFATTAGQGACIVDPEVALWAM